MGHHMPGRLPPRARICHPQDALPKWERKNGQKEGTLERTRTKHGLRKLCNNNNNGNEAVHIFALSVNNT